MDKDEKQRKIRRGRCAGIAFMLLLGVVCGIITGKYLYSVLAAGGTPGEYRLTTALLLVGTYAALILQVVIHEAGHLIFGLMTGYRFLSFRIGSLMWVKENGRLRQKRLTIAGMSGQCLMIPPEEMPEGKIPFVLYNLGGPLSNFASGLLFLGLYFPCRNVPYLSVFLLLFCAVGFAYALINGIPMRLGTVNNDGYNTLSIGKSPAALRAFQIQMKVAGRAAAGERLRDMPEEWFVLPSEEEMGNSMTAAIGVFAYNRLMDDHRFEEAVRLMDRLMATESAIVGLHRGLMICDRVYCGLIRKDRRDLTDKLLDKQQKKFMKAMKNFPSVLRTEYACALLAEKDPEKAARIRARFEECVRSYPYAVDIDSERELLDLADSAAEGKA